MVDGQSILRDTLGVRGGRENGAAPAPSRLQVLPVFPNPFNPTTRLRYGIPRQERVEIKVYDVAGREVMAPLDSEQAEGYHTLVLDGSRLSSGLYFCRVQSGRERAMKGMLLVR